MAMPRVMIIEDSPTQAQQLAFVLEDAGFEIETAPDAERGFDRLSVGRFDLVLSDLHLPGDSGFDLCRRLKADRRLRRIPIVVCTSEADPYNVLRGLEAGADGFITKRREPDEIVGCLRRVLSRPAGDADPDQRTRVAFLGQEFELSAGREQLLDILVSAFEDVLFLNTLAQASALAQSELNRQLEERNLQLQRLAESERQAHEDRKKAESQLVQAEKLSALGLMVAGVAHEVNNPLSFVINNLTVLKRETGVLREMLRHYQEIEQPLAEHRPDLADGLRERAEGLDLAFTLESLDSLFARTDEGLWRIQQIVRNFRDFARLDESDLKEVDLNAGIVSTLNIVRSQAREHRVELETDLVPLPGVTCYPAKVNQVVLNLVVNAIDASAPGERVLVRTRAADDGVEIQVIDEGCGIDPSIRDKIFDPFFTTKPQGKGTGLGLSISYGIVRSHGGEITVEPNTPKGTRFVVRLPLVPAKTEAVPV
jgi:signal transduction histidine kinase